MNKHNHLILFDGTCHLCNWIVRFIMHRDPRGVFLYAPLQGETAKKLWARREKPGVDSVVLVENYNGADERVFIKSDAAMRMLGKMGGIWPLASGLRVVPRFLRDAAYDFVSENRYRWFGKMETCRRPSAGEKERFLP